MKKHEAPQDQAKALAGQRKLLYVVGEGGDYEGVASSGWEPEDEATLAAVAEIDRMANEALGRAQRGETSPLEYYMYARRMEPATLSQTTGLPGWRIRRHFRPEVFRKLSRGLMARYAEALGMSPDELHTVPAGASLRGPER